MREKAEDIFTVLGLSTITISLNWTQINGALTALLLILNSVYVARKLRKKE